MSKCSSRNDSTPMSSARNTVWNSALLDLAWRARIWNSATGNTIHSDFSLNLQTSLYLFCFNQTSALLRPWRCDSRQLERLLRFSESLLDVSHLFVSSCVRLSDCTVFLVLRSFTSVLRYLYPVMSYDMKVLIRTQKFAVDRSSIL